jgi:NAD(P)-dependent dehydrogenase (short-subunit alcohol dehydrogenase family)
VSIVTGAASGIGRSTAEAVGGEGAAVVLVDRAPEVDDVAASMPGRSLAIELDLVELDRLAGVVEQAVDRFGRVDHLVNCAGITGPPMTLQDVDLDVWDHVYTVNVKAPLVLCRHVAARMIEQGAGGRIVNVSSSSAFRARMSTLAYGSSKAALVQLTRSLAAELGPHSINVNAVAPGLTKTAINTLMGDDRMAHLAAGDGPLGNLLGRVSEPSDVAGVIVFLCSAASRQITGQTIHTSAGAIV